MMPDVAAGRDVSERIVELRARIASVARGHGRDPAAIALLGVTKGQTRAAVAAAVAGGLSEIGENYVQEARPKYAALEGARKHFLGRLQTNKARAIVATFDVVQTVDRLEAGLALGRAARALGRPLRALVQVNVCDDGRAGTHPSQASALAERLREDAGLAVDGVMALGPAQGSEAERTRAFTRAAEAFEEVGGTMLSLGMSDDWEAAVACGSTMVRLGTALFGPRTGVTR